MVLYWTNIAQIRDFVPVHPGRSKAPGSAWAWSLLAYAVWEQWSCKLPEIALTAGGKPFFPSRPDLCFSLSHTKTVVLAAVSSFPIGADVEFRRETRPALERRLLEVQHGDLDLFELWHRQSMRLANGMITRQDYDEWRYNYPASQAALEQAARDKRRKNKAPIDEE